MKVKIIGIKHLLLSVFAITAMLFMFLFISDKAEAKTITITTPEQLVNINWKNEGFGPGNTYVIGNDMTLGDGEYATCRLTQGDFVIDFNGHTVQNANNALTVFVVSGANVVMRDSKVRANTPSVRSYGAGAVQITSGSLTINSGNYFGLSNGTNNPSGLHVGGGTCVVNGGGFYGDYVGASVMGGALYVNGAAFQAGYSFALMQFGDVASTIKVSRGSFMAGTTTYGYQFAIGAYSPQSYYDFNTWLAEGSSFSVPFQVGYWNMQSSVTAYPTMSNYYAASYNTPSLVINNDMTPPPATKLKSLTAKKNALKISWSTQGGNTTGYQIEYSKNKNFKGKKTLVVRSNSKSSAKISKLKKKTKYYVRIRTYRAFNGTELYSAWSKAKSKKTK